MNYEERKKKILEACRRVVASGGKIVRGKFDIDAEGCCAIGATCWPPPLRGPRLNYRGAALAQLDAGPDWAEAFASGFDGFPSTLAARRAPVACEMGVEIFNDLDAAGMVVVGG